MRRDKLRETKAWMKEQRIPHGEAMMAMQYLQHAFKSKTVHGRDGKQSHKVEL